jgi:hypothetical protein
MKSQGDCLMSKIINIVLVVVIALAPLVAWKFGRLGAEQMLYLGKMLAGWFSWTVAVSVIYWAFETLFPLVLCPSPANDSFTRTERN